MTGGKATKHIVETIAKVIFLICAAVAIVAVLSITVYMFAKGTPALAKVGVIDLLFGTVWQPTAATQKAGSNCSASGRTTGCDSVCNLRIVGAYGFKSIDVPFGKAGICRQHHPSVYRWFQSAFCDYCAGNYDSANRDKHQCFFDPCSTRTFKVGFSCTWGNTYPDDI